MDANLLAIFSLEGRGAVVIGAATGIGRETAVTFARAGARVTVADINRDQLDATVEAVRPWCAAVDAVVLDVRDREAVQALADRAAEAGSVDAWANVAGVISASHVADTTPEALARILDVNLKGTYWGCAAAARIMSAQGSGSIINVSSAGADTAPPGLSVYSMSKAAVNMLTRTLATEIGPSGVRVNAVAPGFVDTPMVSYRYVSADGQVDEALREEIFASRAAVTVINRIGQPIDIALAMLYLASDASSFVTGQILRPNGGMVMP